MGKFNQFFVVSIAWVVLGFLSSFSTVESAPAHKMDISQNALDSNPVSVKQVIRSFVSAKKSIYSLGLNDCQVYKTNQYQDFHPVFKCFSPAFSLGNFAKKSYLTNGSLKSLDCFSGAKSVACFYIYHAFW